MFKINLLLSFILIIESILLFLSIYFRLKILTASTFILLLILCGYLIVFHFDKNILLIKDLETQKIGKRHEYYAKELGTLYKNRIGMFYFNNFRVYTSEISNNLFSSLDFNSYFPLKYPTILVFFFIAGLFSLLINISKTTAIYLLIASILSSFISFESNFGAILFFPFINLGITVGLLKLLSFLK